MSDTSINNLVDVVGTTLKEGMPKAEAKCKITQLLAVDNRSNLIRITERIRFLTERMHEAESQSEKKFAASKEGPKESPSEEASVDASQGNGPVRGEADDSNPSAGMGGAAAAHEQKVESPRSSSQAYYAGKLIDYDFWLDSAAEFLTNYQFYRRKCVIRGQKEQGKTQFLFFLLRLLQAFDECVIYITPDGFRPTEGQDDPLQDPEHWVPQFKETSRILFGEKAHTEILEKLSEMTKKCSASSFHAFRTAVESALKELRRSDPFGTARVWILNDEITSESFKDFPLSGMDQQIAQFHFVVTGSAGIGKYVSDNHISLGCCWDLPLFTEEKCGSFALTLADSLSCWDALQQALNLRPEPTKELATDGVGSRLFQLYSGIPGYVANCILDVCAFGIKGLMHTWNDIFARVNTVLSNANEAGLLNDLSSNTDKWMTLRELGLCGAHGNAPGIIVGMVLRVLARNDSGRRRLISIATELKNSAGNDMSLRGALLELTTILTFKLGDRLRIAGLELEGDKWKRNGEKTLLSGTKTMEWSYDGKEIQGGAADGESKTVQWIVVELPTGFNVLDVVIVRLDPKKNEATRFKIQITISADPFEKHYTDETCPEASAKVLESLDLAIEKKMNPELHWHESFVMIAPNADPKRIVPHDQTRPFFFSPEGIIQDETQPRKRRANEDAKKPPARKTPKENGKKPSKAQKKTNGGSTRSKNPTRRSTRSKK